MTVERCDQSDAEAVADIADRYDPFDLVIDDGSHVGEHAWISDEALFSRVRYGGTYDVEDIHTSYVTDFGGGPPSTPGTAVALAESLIDRLPSRKGWRASMSIRASPSW